MRDFTLEAYRNYLLALKARDYTFMRFDTFLKEGAPSEDSICLIRHDVDRKPGNALKMAALEKELGLPASYYFRCKSVSFDVGIIKQIAGMGHEVGYHYETMSDCGGDKEKAYALFKSNLEKLRKITPINTICMHGRPFSKFDNRDLWKDEKYHERLLNELGIMGELYLDIDYSNIAYINDTGRNWTVGKANVRDKVNSTVTPNFKNGDELLNWFKNKAETHIVFQVHPERWSDGLKWMFQLYRDGIINLAKKIV